MTQRQLNRAVARVTGESIATIARMGFSHFDDDPSDREPLDRGMGQAGRSASRALPSAFGQTPCNRVRRLSRLSHPRPFIEESISLATITRRLAYHLRAVCRRAFGNRGPYPNLSVSTSPDGLVVRAKSADVAVEYRGGDGGPQKPPVVPVPTPPRLRGEEGRSGPD